MGNLAAVVLQFILGLFGYGKKADPAAAAEQAGETKQALKDTGAAYDDLTKAADSRANADLDGLRRDPGTTDIDPDPAKDHPNLRYRD